ncbi:MAG: hypothetical protein ACOH13_02080 [Flavobacteriales bacterium]
MSLETTLIPWLLGIHATAGGIALVVAPMAMYAHKGGDWHRRWGRVFFYGMIVVCATAIALGILHPQNFWLALVAVFSFYLVASGYRSLYLKKLHKGLRPAKLDMALQGIAGVVNWGLLIWGLAHLILGTVNTQAILFTVFGLIGSLLVVNGVMKFFGPRHDKREWLYGHIAGFIGGYIATLSAFSAVNLTMIEPDWLQWLWPTIIGVPLIFLTIGRLKGRFAKGERLRTFAEVRIK